MNDTGGAFKIAVSIDPDFGGGVPQRHVDGPAFSSGPRRWQPDISRPAAQLRYAGCGETRPCIGDDDLITDGVDPCNPQIFDPALGGFHQKG